MFVTLSFAQRRYILKEHIKLTREQFEKRRGIVSSAGGA